MTCKAAFSPAPSPRRTQRNRLFHAESLPAAAQLWAVQASSKEQLAAAQAAAKAERKAKSDARKAKLDSVAEGAVEEVDDDDDDDDALEVI